jgi:hypothetical protein
LLILIVGSAIGTGLCVVAVLKTARYQGWGQQRWAPPAVPWFVEGFIVLVLTLVAASLFIN